MYKFGCAATELMGDCQICKKPIKAKNRFVPPIEALGFTTFTHETCFDRYIEKDILAKQAENEEWMQNYLHNI